MKKQPYDQVTLRIEWNGDRPCEIGDELVTLTGRRYQVLSITGKKFLCMVLPPDATVQSNQWTLYWHKRRKRHG